MPAGYFDIHVNGYGGVDFNSDDLNGESLHRACERLRDGGVDGIIATNTTVARPPALESPARAESGGLSGVPVRDRATDIIRYLALRTAGQLPIVGVGGVFAAADVLAKLRAGASLVQIYTGFVYEGPLLARRINRGLLQYMAENGLDSLADLRE